MSEPMMAGPVDLTPEQVTTLLAPINANRVQELRGMAHLEAWDVRRWLNRVFGFGGWSSETRELVCISEREINTGRWTVVYRAQIRLTVKTTDGRTVSAWDDAAMGDSRNQPSLGDAHDMAMKTALSQALKRCAVNLGDGFGLSLYNNGSTKPVTVWSAAHPVVKETPEEQPDGDEPVQPEQIPNVAPPGAPEQAMADLAGKTVDRAVVQNLYRQARTKGLLSSRVNASGQVMELGTFLISRGNELAAEAKKPSEEAVGEVTSEEAEWQRAVDAVKAFAEEHSVEDIERAAYEALGAPLKELAPSVIWEYLTALTQADATVSNPS